MLNAIGIYVGKNVLSGGPAPVPAPVATAATGVGDTSFIANWNVYSGAVYYLLDVSISSSFGSFILQDQPVYTNYFTVTGLIPNRTYYYRVRANTDYDTDAQAYFDRVTTAGGSLTITERTSVNALVLDMKYAGVWSSMKAVYPMVGSSAAACAQNLISSSYTGSFSSGWTYSNLGVSGDGTSSYFQTNLNPSTQLTSSVTATAYLNSAYTTAGSYPIIFNAVLAPSYNYWGGGDWNESYMGSTSSLIGPASQTRTGFFNRRARTGEQVAWRNTTSIGTSSVNYTPANATYTLAVNDVYGVHNGRYAFVSFGDYITNTQSTTLYTIVQTFQTRLSRQVGTPIVPDADLQGFINRVYTAGGTLSNAEVSSVSQLTTDLKVNNLWSKMKAIYPMLGASAAACAQNLRSAGFTGSFSSGWTYASTGVTPNGTSAFMNTGLMPSSQLTASSTHISYYSRTDTTTNDGVEIGSWNTGYANGIEFALNRSVASPRTYMTLNSTPASNVLGGSQVSSGFFIGSRTSSSLAKIYKNNSIVGTNSSSYTLTLSSFNLYLGASNDFGTGGAYSTKQCAFASIGDGLTDAEASNLYTYVQSFQTRLSRQVDKPIVSDADAQAFVDRVYTAGGTLSGAEPIAVNQMTIDLKTANLWAKIQAIYPMVGASAAACSQNLKSSSFTATFTAGWTFTSQGVTGNAASTYMDTGFVPSTNFASFNSGASLYSRTNSTAVMYDYGVQASGGIGHNVYLNYSGVGLRWHLQCVFADRPAYTPPGTQSNGFYIGVTGAANDRRAYRNAVLIGSNTSISTTNLTTLNQSIPLGCLRDTGTGFQAYSNRQYSLFALHQSLTVSEVNDFTSINLIFQTTLSRNV